jgi:hypothetical protein
MKKARRIRVTPQRKRKPDYRNMSAALQAYLAAQAEAEAQQQQPERPPKRRQA